MRKDIMFGNVSGKYDLMIENGDFVIDQSDWQHTRHILEATQGQYRQFPLVGVGIRYMLNGPLAGAEKRTIQLQLEADQIKARSIDFKNDLLSVKL